MSVFLSITIIIITIIIIIIISNIIPQIAPAITGTAPEPVAVAVVTVLVVIVVVVDGDGVVGIVVETSDECSEVVVGNTVVTVGGKVVSDDPLVLDTVTVLNNERY